MKISSYEEIVALDKELAGLFLQKDEAGKWIYAMEHGFKEWISEKKSKQYWEFIRYVTQKKEILGKKNKKGSFILTRNDFARVALKYCPDAFEENESISALTSSMEHFRYNNELRNIEKELDGSIVRRYIGEVESILDGTHIIIEPQEKKTTPTPHDILEKYLRKIVDEQTDKFPRSALLVRPPYEYLDSCPAFSIEIFFSKKFLDEKKPSYIMVYEYIDGELDKNKLYELYGKYRDFTNVKLFIYSLNYLKASLQAKASEYNIGYIRINPNSDLIDENFILPRSIEDYTKRQYDLKVLAGEKPMTMPLLIYDSPIITSSLSYILNNYHVVIKNNQQFHIQHLSDQQIENAANVIISDDVNKKLKSISSSAIPNLDLCIDPFAYAKSVGLSYETKTFDDNSQLGWYDVENKHITLNSAGLENHVRYRFTMGHEIGHHVLHSALFKKQHIMSVGENEDFLTINKQDSNMLEYQANKFASCLLMPRMIVKTLYVYTYNKYVKQVYGTDFRPLYYSSKQPETWQSYHNVVGNMARMFGVSVQAMSIRLQSLGLLTIHD